MSTFANEKYVAKARTANGYKNNGATVIYGGAIDTNSTTVTNAPGMTTVGYHSGRHGSKVPSARSAAQIAAGATIPTFKPYSAGNFAQMEAGQYLIRRYHNKLAGVANTLLNSGASHYPGRRSIHKLERLRTTFLSAYSWTAPTGNNASGDPRTVATYSATESDQNSLLYSPNTDGFDGNDNAARPTRALPGELVYIETGKTPTQDDYAEKTG